MLLIYCKHAVIVAITIKLQHAAATLNARSAFSLQKQRFVKHAPSTNIHLICSLPSLIRTLYKNKLVLLRVVQQPSVGSLLPPVSKMVGKR